MKHITTLLALFILCASCQSKQKESTDTSETVPANFVISPNWKEATSLNLEITKTRIIEKEKRSSTVNSVSEIEVNLSKADANTWNCIWEIKDITIPKKNISLEDKLSELTKGMKYEFVLDSTGNCIDLKNWTEFKNLAGELLVVIANKEGVKNPNQEAIELNANTFQAIDALIKQYNTKESVEEVALQDPRLYFFLNGLEINAKDTIKTDAFAIHSLTKDLVKQDIKIFPLNISEEVCNIQVIKTFDKEATQQSVKNFFIKQGEKIKDEKDLQRITTLTPEIVTSILYTISTKTGAVEKVIAETSSKISGATSIDKRIKDAVRTDRVEIIRK